MCQLSYILVISYLPCRLSVIINAGYQFSYMPVISYCMCQFSVILHVGYPLSYVPLISYRTYQLIVIVHAHIVHAHIIHPHIVPGYYIHPSPPTQTQITPLNHPPPPAPPSKQTHPKHTPRMRVPSRQCWWWAISLQLATGPGRSWPPTFWEEPKRSRFLLAQWRE